MGRDRGMGEMCRVFEAMGAGQFEDSQDVGMRWGKGVVCSVVEW